MLLANAGIAEADAHVARYDEFDCLMKSQDVIEGPRALAEKRRPGGWGADRTAQLE